MNTSVPEAVIYSGHPSWRSMLDFHLAGLIAAAAGGAIARLATKNWGLAIAVFAGVLALSVLIGFIRRGILSRTEQHTTIDRVQNVETRQSLLERVLRIGTVDFDTAGTDDSQFSFEGVATPKQVVAAVDRAQQLTPRSDPLSRG